MARLFHLTPPTILALIHISVPLLVPHIAPKFRFYLNTAPQALLVHHTSGMSNTSPDATPPSATAWIQSRLTALYEDVHARGAFDWAFSPACEVRVNHEMCPLQTLRDDLASRRAAATHVRVAWDPSVVSTGDDDKPNEPAVVAGSLVVTRSLPFRIRAGPAQRETHVRFSAKIERDASVQDGDQRRITSFYYTAVDRTPPIHLAVPAHAAQGGSDGQ